MAHPPAKGKRLTGGDKTGTARVFFALWPDECCARRLSAIAADLAARWGGRATPPALLHLTLAFVGDVSEARLPDLLKMAGEVSEVLKEALREAPGNERQTIAPVPPEFGLFQLDRLACRARNRMLWAECSDCPAMLERLADLLAGSLRKEGDAISRRRFTPHVTLVRKLTTIPPAGELDAFDALQAAPVAWRYGGFVLLRSCQSGAGTAYECLGSWTPGRAPD